MRPFDTYCEATSLYLNSAMHRPLLGLIATLPLLLINSTVSNADATLFQTNAGVLDRPLPVSPTIPNTGIQQPAAILFTISSEITVETIRSEYAEENKMLEALPREVLEARAERGERAAQIALGAEYAKEAALLTFAPEAAKDALADAVSLYSRAAEFGFPGSPSLDQVGVKFFPVRAPRPL